MKTDSYFTMGGVHITDCMPCQDYATDCVLGEAALAIVSDGCSTGGGQTDNGSRIVVRAALRALTKHWRTIGDPLAGDAAQGIALEQLIVMGGSKDLLSLTQADLYATSLYAYYTKSGGLVHVLGDGAVAWEDEDGTLTLVRFEWLKPDDTRPPAPFYPVYYEDNYKAFLDYYGGDLNGKFLRAEIWVFTPGSAEPKLVETRDYTLAESIVGPKLILPANLRLVAVFTDGVTQIEGIEWKSAARQLLAFKGTTGVFAKRRMSRFCRDAKKVGRGPLDDLSYAVIYCDDETEEG